jgi:CheY-like chemotaxis protein
LLAVDDSKTMRKVLEITFAGEDYRMVLVNSPADAMAKVRSERPAIALVDALLGGSSGYDLCQQIKAEAPQVGVIVLSSKQHPYDRVKGGAVGADDFIDKPYDSQALIDKVAALAQKLASAPAARPAAPAAAPAARAATDGGTRPGPVAHAPAAAAAPMRNTMSFGAPSGAPASTTPIARPAPQVSPAAQPQAASPFAKPAAAPAAVARPVVPTAAAPHHPAPVAAQAPAAVHAAPAAAPAVASPAALVGASMEQKLVALGLTKDQISGVLSLSREVVEQVVWEVVPVLAETMIREEINRLTAE